MKQILQNLRDGETILAEVPRPRRSQGSVLIQTTDTLVSLGTEKMLIDFGKGGLIAKARSQPDKVKQVLQKIRTDGLWTTIDAVKAKLDTPIPLGYCNVGVVQDCDSDSGYCVGQRVVSNGPHAEYVSVGKNLTAAIPENVTGSQAAFTVIGAIALQGVRLVQPTLGERVVVFGLGLIGQLAVQILRANGCQVLGVDFDPNKLELAKKAGAQTCDLSTGQDPIAAAENWTEGIGADAVLITASTKSDELIHQAATICRRRAKIVLVGVVGLNLRRADFYEKELSFQVSCSYGPGRYDSDYEQRGIDYPIGFVRWTEQRNFQAVLELMSEGKINVDSLITHRYGFDDALSAYEAVSDPTAMGIMLQYACESTTASDSSSSGEPSQRHPCDSSEQVSLACDHPAEHVVPGLNRDVRLAFVGAGGFATRMLMPLIPESGVVRSSVASSKGVSSSYAKEKFGFKTATTQSDSIFLDDNIDVVLITTPHHLHADMICRALESGKHVFVEKPLAITQEQFEQVRDCMDAHPDLLMMVGFNRRFSPHMVAMKQWAESAASNRAVVITVNAGKISKKHWTQDRRIGGGRIIGEACHFIDTARFLVGHPLVASHSFPIAGGDGRLGDCVSIQLSFADGSIATVHYLSNGNKSFPKERVELFSAGKIFQCDNFRVTREIGGKRKLKTRKQDKGHADELTQLFRVLREGGAPPISREEILEVSQAAISCSG